MQNSVLTKRKNVSDNTRSKKPKIFKSLTCQKKFVFATHIKNYFNNDTLSDYLKLKYGKQNNNEFNNFVINQGIKFEKEIVKYINDNIHNVVKVADKFSDYNCMKTIEYMKKGIPILHSAPVQNFDNNTGGIIDLLIRSDYINKLFDIFPISEKETTIYSPKLKQNYYYIVIDIKFITMNLTAKNDNILNTNNIPFYKGQCYIYTNAVSKIQGYSSRYAFILGRGWKNKSRNISSSYALNKLGKIDYKKFDSKIIKKTTKAVSWIRKLHKKWQKWSISPPTIPELYPNLCVVNEFQDMKKKIANDLCDITQIWNCNIKNRNIAFKNNILSWKDENCNSKTLGINSKYNNIIDKIININRQDKDKILYKKINNNYFKNNNNVFVDFETITNIFDNFNNIPHTTNTNMIFMIGVGYSDKNNNWNYKNFSCKNNTYEEEYRIMNEFVNLLKELKNPNIYHWSPAEKSFWKNAENRQFKLNSNKENIIYNFKINNWIDLSKFFKESEIVLKDCFNYGLKNIAHSMKKYNMIETDLTSSCNNGLSAMFQANNYFQEKDEKILSDIINYNEFDCKVIWEIFNYFKNNKL